MTDFTLRHVVRDVLAETTEADPGKLAGLVLARIPKKDYHAALSQALRLFVRQIISETRTGHNAPAPTPIQGSRKVAAIREGWQRRLNDRIHVGDSAWKVLRDCTYDDLLHAAQERRSLAERNAAWARQYDAWARLLTEHDVETFGDLAAEVQMQALGRAA